jgi:hypothetical protein
MLSTMTETPPEGIETKDVYTRMADDGNFETKDLPGGYAPAGVPFTDRTGTQKEQQAPAADAAPAEEGAPASAGDGADSGSGSETADSGSDSGTKTTASRSTASKSSTAGKATGK